MTPLEKPLTEIYIQDSLAWLERAVIGLNLCPFAKAVHVHGQVHCAVSQAKVIEELTADLLMELKALAQADPQVRDTTLLIVPHMLQDFFDYNDFLTVADGCLASLDLQGQIQIASFHPMYQFAGTAQDDITNFTNRSPYPTLHLIRESSIDRAVKAFPNADAIFETNMATLRQLGLPGWQALNVGPTPATKGVDEKSQ